MRAGPARVRARPSLKAGVRAREMGIVGVARDKIEMKSLELSDFFTDSERRIMKSWFLISFERRRRQ